MKITKDMLKTFAQNHPSSIFREPNNCHLFVSAGWMTLLVAIAWFGHYWVYACITSVIALLFWILSIFEKRMQRRGPLNNVCFGLSIGVFMPWLIFVNAGVEMQYRIMGLSWIIMTIAVAIGSIYTIHKIKHPTYRKKRETTLAAALFPVLGLLLARLLAIIFEGPVLYIVILIIMYGVLLYFPSIIIASTVQLVIQKKFDIV